ncbi:hypothetical protein ZIOFF_016696 [Zingiber officinale]|uniref:Uncharacterized protein n=1 Tax=Zingiber officinale TaxID=94328 RepID=A0A8J5LR21_ZINOF|nr:hypothetical protein ZIOFF_016696 [Zingiber officinale]
MAKESEEMRKGPWTKEEDLRLACFVALFGERRWDFIARVSGRIDRNAHGLINFADCTDLVLEKSCCRWSRIARRLPGRTDNEIKNYWRTHMRKKAQEQRKSLSAFAPSASFPTPVSQSGPQPGFTDEGQLSTDTCSCSMDQIWDEIDVSEEIAALAFHE